ncbi:MAG: DUF3341 domain-containing protein [Planctomycetes bacterium]|nr:DUF3341 domain-containing protein [Planctomycetota bacterium]
MAEFDHPDKLVDAARKASAAGYTRMDCYSPYPVGEAADAMGFPKSEMGSVMFIGGLIGATAGFLMQYLLGAYDYPINVGGRPFFSWPSFVPITFEMMVLTAALSGVFGLFAVCGLPMLYHPVFNVPAFARASGDHFFLCIEAVDPKYDPVATRDFLAGLQPLDVAEVPE